MTIGVCITARHRPHLLEECLQHIERSTLRPVRIVVSDDSSSPEMLEANARVVSRFAPAVYVRGPQRGVCANRNNALSYVRDVDYVASLDDDGLVAPDYFAVAQATLDAMPESRRALAILTGLRFERNGHRNGGKCRLSFTGYFIPSPKTQVAGASYAIYPRSFFDRHLWDEQIYFGYEDAELSLRALKDGYEIVQVDGMTVTDGAAGQSTLAGGGEKIPPYTFAGEAARLYIGVKRFKDIEANYAKLAVFLPLFFAQVSYSLAKRGALQRLPELVRMSRVTSLLHRA
jgi:glycosyltransferase involved in cell wall biosynthesis